MSTKFWTKPSQKHTDNTDFTDLHGQILHYFLYIFDYQYVLNLLSSVLNNVISVLIDFRYSLL